MSADEPPEDGPHWWTPAKAYEMFQRRHGNLAEYAFNEWMDSDERRFRLTTASGFPRRTVCKVLSPGTRVDSDDDRALDPSYGGEIEVRINGGEPICAGLEIWVPPAAVEPEPPPVSPAQEEPVAPSPSPVPDSPTREEPVAPSPPPSLEQTEPAKRAPKHPGGRDPEYDWDGAASHVDKEVADHGPLRRHKKTGEPIKAQARDLMLQWFEGSKKAAPQSKSGERTVEKWINTNWQRCQHWWAASTPTEAA